MPRPERYETAMAAVTDIPDGASIFVAGFHAGVPWNLMQALYVQGAKDLVAISTSVNRPLLDVDGRVTIADLVLAGRVQRVIASFTAAPHPSQPNAAEQVFRDGGAEAELVPQGTLAERIRAGSTGIPAFYTPAGIGSSYAKGRESRNFDGREYLLERGLRADYAFVRAWREILFFGVRHVISTRLWPVLPVALLSRWMSRFCQQECSTLIKYTHLVSMSRDLCISVKTELILPGGRGGWGVKLTLIPESPRND